MTSAASTPDDTTAFAPPIVVAASSDDAPLPSRFLGLGVVGRSEASVVHKAYDLATGTTVAVSVPTSPRHANRDVIAMTARITHPAAARVLGEAHGPAGVCCVMEFVEGRPLAEILPLLRDRTLASLTLEELAAPCCIDRRRLARDIAALAARRGAWQRLAVRWIIDVCGVVRQAHELGLSTLAPRPTRLLLRADGTVALTGLALARPDAAPVARAADARDLAACLTELLTLHANPPAAAMREVPAPLVAACDACMTAAGDAAAVDRFALALDSWLRQPRVSGLAALLGRFRLPAVAAKSA